MNSSATMDKIAPALVATINAIDGVKKGAANPAFKGTKYATLEAVIEAAHEHLSANGLAVMQGPGPMQGNALTLTTRLIHVSGEWIETDFTIPLSKQDPQAAGSAVTYARRYSLMAMLNMPAVDDDGEAAMQRAPQRQAEPETSAAADFAIAQLQRAKTRDEFTAFWDANKGPLREQLSTPEYARVLDVMRTEAVRISAAEDTPFTDKKAA